MSALAILCAAHVHLLQGLDGLEVERGREEDDAHFPAGGRDLGVGAVVHAGRRAENASCWVFVPIASVQYFGESGTASESAL